MKTYWCLMTALPILLGPSSINGWVRCHLMAEAGIILCMPSGNERWRYAVTPSLIDWAHTQNDPAERWTSFLSMAGQGLSHWQNWAWFFFYGPANSQPLREVGHLFFGLDSDRNVSYISVVKQGLSQWDKALHMLLPAWADAVVCCTKITFKR